MFVFASNTKKIAFALLGVIPPQARTLIRSVQASIIARFGRRTPSLLAGWFVCLLAKESNDFGRKFHF